MSFAIGEMLAPVSEAAPLGPALSRVDEFADLKELIGAAAKESADRPATKVNWSRVQELALGLAQRGRDLRVWVWLTRASLVTEGLPGLARGLELITRGLEQYWDTIEPIDTDIAEPRERFLGRVMALAELGVTSFQADLDTLSRSGRTIVNLRSDLDATIARTAPDESARNAIDDCRTAIRKIGNVFRAGFGDRADPQLGFELLLAKLTAVEAKLSTAPPRSSPGANGIANGHGTPPALEHVGSRDDVVRALDQVLAYYAAHEPSSPVPLLVSRAKRLVSMSFLDALKDLAPGGMKELQAVAGTVDDSRK
jgi:type VI secretion system protein ImpA